MKFHARSAAKVNLSLDILSRRPDGYHELASIVHTIGLWDEIEGAIGPPSTMSLECDVPELGGDDNLCLRAVQRFQEATGLDFGMALRLRKRIPTGAGLGGGSGNAATVLRALNRAFGEPLDEMALVQVGARLGADVPLFLRGGAVLMEGIGEKLTPLPSLAGWLLVIKPQVSLSTPAVYRAWDEAELKSSHGTQRLLRAWNVAAGPTLNRVASELSNDLERASSRLQPTPARCVEYLHQVGSLGSLMSGSGSACFGLFDTQDNARAAQAQLQALVAKDVLTSDSTIFVVPFSRHGVEWIQSG